MSIDDKGEHQMGVILAQITLSNPRHDNLRPITVEALVDTGSMYTVIPEHLAIQLKLDTLLQREVTLADGSSRLCPYVGPIVLAFEDRSCFTGGLVMGQQVLLGAIPMGDMDLVVNPLTRTLGVNPLSPNIPSGIAMKVAQKSTAFSAITR